MGGDGYVMFKDLRPLIAVEKAREDTDIFAEALSSVRTISPQVEGRISRIEDRKAGLNSSVACVTRNSIKTWLS